MSVTLVTGEVTRLLEDWGGGDERAFEELWQLVYHELRRLAASYLRGEREDHVLQPTALVHEAYLRVLDMRHIGWQSRAHFIGVAAQMMRRVLVDHARERDAEKRGGGVRPVSFSEADLLTPAMNLDLLALGEALDRLEEAYPEKCRVVELRFFGGLSIEETAHILGVSTPTVERDWRFARAWLHAALTG